MQIFGPSKVLKAADLKSKAAIYSTPHLQICDLVTALAIEAWINTQSSCQALCSHLFTKPKSFQEGM